MDEQKKDARRMAMIHPYTYTSIDTYPYIIYRYVLWKTVGFKSSVYTVHIQVCTSGNKKLQGPESKPAKKLRQFNLVEICKNTVSFAMKYCIVLSH